MKERYLCFRSKYVRFIDADEQFGKNTLLVGILFPAGMFLRGSENRKWLE